MFAIRLAACAAVLLGCSELPDIGTGVCGNGVIEVGEDCDGTGTGGTCAGDGANACFYVCADGATCPEGSVCGVDERCRVASGTFADQAASGPYSFTAQHFTIGDVDADGIGDLLGTTESALRVRFGSPSGDLSAELDTAIRTPTGRPFFGRLDDDEATDVVLPVAAGVVTLLGAGRRFDPFAYTSIPLPVDNIPVVMAPVEAYLDIDTEILRLHGTDMKYQGSLQPARTLPGGYSTMNLATGRLPTGRLTSNRWSGTGDATDEFALAFSGANAVYVYRPTGIDPPFSGANNLDVVAHATVNLPADHFVGRGGAHFGYFDQDGCVDLLVHFETTAAGGTCAGETCEGFAVAHGLKTDVTMGNPSDYQNDLCLGTLESTARVQQVARPTSLGDPAPKFSVLAVGDFNQDAVDDIVTDSLIFRLDCAVDGDGVCNGSNGDLLNPGFLYLTASPWLAAVTTDVNGDHRVDVAAIREGLDGVDVLINSSFGPFNRYAVDTASPVKLLRAGDFDGDLYPDIALIEASAAQGGLDRLSVIYGNPAGGPTAPQPLGSFDEVTGLEPISAVPDVESIDAITDLMLIAKRDSGGVATRGAAALLGTTTRSMLSPFILVSSALQVPDLPVALAVGQFEEGGGVDMAVLALPGTRPFEGDAGDTTANVPPRGWRLSGSGDGNLSVNLVADENPRDLPESSLFEVVSAAWVSGDLDGDGMDEMIGVDQLSDDYFVGASQPSRIVVFSPNSASAPTLVTFGESYRVIRQISLADLDRDGDLDLLAEFQEVEVLGVPATPIIVWNQDGRLDTTATTELGAGCRDAAPIQLDGDGELEMALLCGDLIHFRDLDPIAHTFGEPQVGLGAGNPEGWMVVGDLNGDRLDDIALTRLVGNGQVVSVAIQCAATAPCTSLQVGQ